MWNISLIRLFLFLLIAGVIYSCEKENKPGKDNVITIGNYSGLKVIHHDTILVGGYNNKRDYFLDVDGDGNNDFVLSSNIWGSPGMGQHPEADIASLGQQFFFNMIEYQDTFFMHAQNDTFYSNEVAVYLRKYYTCSRMYPNDSIHNVANNHFIRVLKQDQTISENDLWLSDTLDLNHPLISYHNVISLSQDTIVIEEIIYFNECHSFPNDIIAWIGIGKKDAEKIRLGWIKISISEDYKITILETTIQE
ncbi:MAG: hypothetical protein IPH20_21930 [Bacteroidales bacterium]|nr:hypothetical protein [Bacteroidales bacterium]